MPNTAKSTPSSTNLLAQDQMYWSNGNKLATIYATAEHGYNRTAVVDQCKSNARLATATMLAAMQMASISPRYTHLATELAHAIVCT